MSESFSNSLYVLWSDSSPPTGFVGKSVRVWSTLSKDPRVLQQCCCSQVLGRDVVCPQEKLSESRGVKRRHIKVVRVGQGSSSLEI